MNTQAEVILQDKDAARLSGETDMGGAAALNPDGTLMPPKQAS
jgi:hypothetical protein